jgi:hypothetical protein
LLTDSDDYESLESSAKKMIHSKIQSLVLAEEAKKGKLAQKENIVAKVHEFL